MNSLIEEIQREALDLTIPVSTLLRKVRLAAAKLKLDTVEEWVTNELSGYEETVPAYRILRGTVRYNNGYTGWQMLLGDTSSFSQKGNGQSISQIESMLEPTGNQTFHIPFSGKLAEMIGKAAGGGQASYALFIDRAQLSGVLSAVRNLVLDWAINLEKAGIKGDGMSFSEREKKIAESSPSSITIGTINSLVGSIGSHNSVGSITIGSFSIDAARSVVPQLRGNAAALAKLTADPAGFSERLQKVEQELMSSKPDPSSVKATLTDIRAALSGAAGNLIASGALTLLNNVLGTGVPA
ncbi:hypothetical protein ABIF63_004885 [Bradyrhizobium japonicum]|uniref:AbiTii domain-containing protein n=1 Tax=Bradyrhizobium japonicum TaxID=375 RepID=A0ABV2RUZ8_BRAJP|nr:hypothetical protein [Bradyrhizobium japonicum]UQD96004.1 hypothetical protein JEY30_31145 [Bradyrhizobium japonicum]WLB16141.1 hypothetical protein QIH95_29350 [Bradyrhizobium japonicum]